MSTIKVKYFFISLRRPDMCFMTTVAMTVRQPEINVLLLMVLHLLLQ